MAITALAAGLQGWLLMKTNLVERLLLLAAGTLVVLPFGHLDSVGVGLLTAAFVMQFLRRPRAAAPP